jgi:hypothetical protein
MENVTQLVPVSASDIHPDWKVSGAARVCIHLVDAVSDPPLPGLLFYSGDDGSEAWIVCGVCGDGDGHVFFVDGCVN